MNVASADPDRRRREMVRRPSCPVLRTYVRGYCGYGESATAVASRVELPSGSVGLIVGLGSAIEVAYPGQRPGSTARVTSFVAGLHDSYAVAKPTGWQQGVQIELTPVGAHMLLGVPMDSLANRVVELDQVLGHFAGRLAEQLHETASWPARFDLLDELITSRLATARPPAPKIAWALRRLIDTGGLLGIGALADELGSSRQYLAAGFREQIGLPPKTLARILRFQRVTRLLEGEGEAAIAQIADECGYYDQAHFNRDFRAFAGRTPSQFLAQLMPDGAGVAWKE